MSIDQKTNNVEVGTDDTGARKRMWRQILVTIGVFVALFIFIGLFYKSNFELLTDRNATDIAQIAKNISEDKGYTTRFIRPFNIVLVDSYDKMLPEVNHAPLFPYAVAALFKLKHGSSDQGLSWVSMTFLILTILATYLLGHWLFGRRVGLLAAVSLGISITVLKAGTSGQEWTMAAFLFILLLAAMVKHFKAVHTRVGLSNLIWVVVSALLVALLYMTNHVLAFLIVPVALYFAFTGEARKLHVVVFLAAAILAMAPWAYRNVAMTGGSVLGANAWDLMTNTVAFPRDIFFRTTDTANHGIARAVLFPIEQFPSFANKLVTGSSDILGAMVPMLGLAMLGFAVVSMLYKFKVASANALRGIMYCMIPLLVVVFALFSVSRHCVVMFAPVAAVFGSAYLFLLLDAKKLHVFYCKALIAGLVLVTSLPALGMILWKTGQEDATSVFFAHMGARVADATVFSDVPWIVAWRTSFTSIWLPRTDKDVAALDARGYPLSTVFLTAEADRYSSDEAWYILHRYKLWRDYAKDPKACIKQIIQYLPQDTREVVGKNVTRFLDSRRRMCVLSAPFDSLEQQPLNQVPTPNPGDKTGTPSDSNAAPDDIMLFQNRQ